LTDVEPKILHCREPRQYLRRTTPNINDFIAGFGSDVAFYEPATQRVAPDAVLNQIVKKRYL
jgi:hypothetical protein